MRPDFELIIHRFPNEDITIIPIADVHLGAEECMEDEFRSFIDSVKDRKDTYYFIAGDLVSNGLKNSVTNVYAEKYRPMEQKRMMAEILAPIRDRILCYTEGNHERRSARDSDDLVGYDICAKLDIEDRYRENMCFLKMMFGETSGAGQLNPTYTAVVSHGSGGGALTGGGVNRFERFGWSVDNADLFVFGHTHKPLQTNPGKLFIDTHNNKVSLRGFKIVVATSWLRSGGYTLQKLLSPTSHALQTITLCGNHKEMRVTM